MLRSDTTTFSEDQLLVNKRVGYTLSQSSFEKLLNPNLSLNEEILSAYCSLINHREKALGLHNLYVYDPLHQYKIDDLSRIERVASNDKINIKNFKLICLPVCVDSSQVLLVVADSVLKSFSIIHQSFYPD